MAGTKPIHLLTPEEYAEFRRVMNERVDAMNASAVELNDVREYAEGYAVSLLTELPSIPYCAAGGVRVPATPSEPRLVVRARNEGGHNSVAIDLVDLLDWLAKHRADLIWKALGTTVERFRTELTTDPESMDGQTKAKAP